MRFRSGRAVCSGLRSEARKGRMLPYVIEVDGEFGGQLTIGNVTHGALRSAWIGYWVASVGTPVGEWRPRRWRSAWTTPSARSGCIGSRRRCVRRTPRAVPCWPRSGFREEGLLRRYLDVDGAWRDHLLVAVTVEEINGSVTSLLVRDGHASWA